MGRNSNRPRCMFDRSIHWCTKLRFCNCSRKSSWCTSRRHSHNQLARCMLPLQNRSLCLRIPSVCTHFVPKCNYHPTPAHSGKPATLSSRYTSFSLSIRVRQSCMKLTVSRIPHLWYLSDRCKFGHDSLSDPKRRLRSKWFSRLSSWAVLSDSLCNGLHLYIRSTPADSCIGSLHLSCKPGWLPSSAREY